MGIRRTKLATVVTKSTRFRVTFSENSTFQPFAGLQSLSLSYNKLTTSNVRNIINGLRNSKVVVSIIPPFRASKTISSIVIYAN